MKIKLATLCLLALSSCASIVNGSTETVAVQTTSGTIALPTAQCSLSNKKGTWTTTTPGSVIVHRGSEPLSVTCTKNGYLATSQAFNAATSGYVYGNILLGGGLGATVDTVNGAAWDYPKTITLALQPNQTN